MNSNLNSTTPNWVFSTSTYENVTEETATEDNSTIMSVKVGLSYAAAVVAIGVIIIAISVFIWKKYIREKPEEMRVIFNDLDRARHNNTHLMDVVLCALRN